MTQLDPLLTACVICEVIAAAYLTCPINLKQKGLMSWVDKQAWTSQCRVLFGAFAVVLLAVTASAAKSTWNFEPSGSMDGNTLAYNREHYLESVNSRNLSAFALVMLIIVERLYVQVVKTHRLEINFTALQSQTKNSGATLTSLMDDKSKLEARLKALEGGAGGGGKERQLSVELTAAEEERTSKEKAELAEAKKKISTMEKELQQVEALKKQALQQQQEYLRVLDDNKTLQEKLDDFEMVGVSNRKKRD